MKRLLHLFMASLLLASCVNEPPNPPVSDPPVPGEGYTPQFNPSFSPRFSYDTPQYNGETANEDAAYTSDDPALNPTLNQWTDKIEVVYQGEEATVTVPEGSRTTFTMDGAHVTINLGADNLTEIVASGSSTDGSLRVTGDKRHLLTLNNLTLNSLDRPAINDQNGKRVFLNLVGTSRLTDGETYLPSSEDRKGCLFAEGHIVMCGKGRLIVEGGHQHGIATDGFLYVNPGVTLVVTNAVRNAIHAKGSKNDANGLRGIEVTGGYVYAHTSAPRGKAMKSDAGISLRGGTVVLAASGDADIDPADGTLSSPACIKGDADVSVSGGNVTLTATGTGAKGIKANGNVSLDGGLLTVAISGDAMQGDADSATPKGIKADQNLAISAGGNYISAIGTNAIGLDADGAATITGGVTYTFGVRQPLRSVIRTTLTEATLLAAGANVDKISGAKIVSLSDIQAGQLTELTGNEGQLSASFRWPVAMDRASILFVR